MYLINPEDIRFDMVPIAPFFVGDSVYYAWVAFRVDVNQIPRIEAERVRHAHWIELKEDHMSCDNAFPVESAYYFTCSECGHSFSDDTPYCPHCGARMDEE